MTSQSSGAVMVKAKVRLEVGLVEAGEHAARVDDLELGVEVDRLVDRVDEAVQPLTGVHVGAVGDDPSSLSAASPVRLDPSPVEGRGVELARR